MIIYKITNMKHTKYNLVFLTILGCMTLSSCTTETPNENYHSITYFDSDNYTLTGPTEAKAGDEITFNITDIKEGYYVDYFLINNVRHDENKFIMADYNTVVEAILSSEEGGNAYYISFANSANGVVASSKYEAMPGEEVPLYIKAKEGYRLKEIKANDVYLTFQENKVGEYYAHYIMQNRDLQVEATFTPIERLIQDYAYSFKMGDSPSSAQSFWKFKYGQDCFEVEVAVVDSTIVDTDSIDVWQKDGVEFQICLSSESNHPEEAKALRFLLACNGRYYVQRVHSDSTYYRLGDGVGYQYGKNFRNEAIECTYAVNGFDGYYVKAYIGYDLFGTDYQGALNNLTFAPAMRDSTAYNYSSKTLSTSWASTSITMTASNMDYYMDTAYHCNWFNPRSYLGIKENQIIVDRYFTHETDLLLIGDSYTMSKYYGSLYDDFKDIKVSTVGFGSSKTYDWTNKRNLKLAETIQPKNIFIHIGGNDFYGGASLETTFSNLQCMINTLKSYVPNVNIYLMSLLRRCWRFDEEEIYTKITQYNSLIDTTYKADQQVHVINLTDKFIRADGTGNQSMFTDDTHPNSYGNAVISNALRKAMGLPLLSDSEKFGSYKNAVATNGFTYEEVGEDTYLRQTNSMSRFSDRYVYFKQDLGNEFTSSAYFNASTFYNGDTRPKFGYILNDGEQQLYFFIDTNDYYEIKNIGLATRTNGKNGTYNYNAVPTKPFTIYFGGDDFTKLSVQLENGNYNFYVEDYLYASYSASFFTNEVSIGFFSFNTQLNVKNPTITLGGTN